MQEAATRQEQMMGALDSPTRNSRPRSAEASNAEAQQLSESSDERNQNSKKKENNSDNSRRGGNRGRGRGRGGAQRGGGSCFERFPCKLCGELGHWVTTCPKIEAAQQLLGKDKQKSEAEANMVLATDRGADHSIALDSCATHHVVKDEFMFEELHSIAPVTVPVANGQTIEAQKAGTIRVFNNEDRTNTLFCGTYSTSLVRVGISAVPHR
ncbi:uncharacterized protein EV422DRAFT_334163 [Fimicolochytrium jonesii]|uniref:uncharacterized protein n=1 Tax=Fimicolochytrium jonesii TaxID=1396493 RepID=UPI0022FEFF8F|nr:uncharacterized protein EV422DRAFT_334163 [Fimicolochytrium jonesii]KAI8815986.1 hypothetical protein EV422DRAFT_334163 [Fimicolochytrium jonesii]